MKSSRNRLAVWAISLTRRIRSRRSASRLSPVYRPAKGLATPAPSRVRRRPPPFERPQAGLELRRSRRRQAQRPDDLHSKRIGIGNSGAEDRAARDGFFPPGSFIQHQPERTARQIAGPGLSPRDSAVRRRGGLVVLNLHPPGCRPGVDLSETRTLSNADSLERADHLGVNAVCRCIRRRARSDRREHNGR